MYRVTRDLIKLRQKYSETVVEKVLVNKIGGGISRRCYENSVLLIEQHPDYKIVSGWFVNKWDIETNSCLVVSHYWNLNEKGIFIDSSIMESVEGEYVIDSEIGVFANENYEKLHSSVCSSLLFKNNSIIGVDFREEGKVYRTYKDFSINSLFLEFNQN